MTDLADFATDLRSEGYSPTTIRTYVSMLRRPLPFTLPGKAREVKNHLAARRDVVSVNRVCVELRALRCFSRWHANEHGGADELAGLAFPRQTTPAAGRIARQDDVRKLVGGLMRSPADIRDLAIVRLLWATGARRSEIVRVKVADLDFESGLVKITATKNGRERHVPMTDDVAQTLTRWLRRRAKHEFANCPELFLSKRGALTANGLGQRMETLSARFGITPALMPHQFRRSLAHRWVSAGGADDALMKIGGWTNGTMPGRYRAEFTAERAIEDYKRLMTPMTTRIKIRPGRRSAQ